MSPTKLSDADKRAIVDLYRQPEETTATVAKRYGVSVSTISRLLKNELPKADYEALIKQKRSGLASSAIDEEADGEPLDAPASTADETLVAHPIEAEPEDDPSELPRPASPPPVQPRLGRPIPKRVIASPTPQLRTVDVTPLPERLAFEAGEGESEADSLSGTRGRRSRRRPSAHRETENTPEQLEFLSEALPASRTTFVEGTSAPTLTKAPIPAPVKASVRAASEPGAVRIGRGESAPYGLGLPEDEADAMAEDAVTDNEMIDNDVTDNDVIDYGEDDLADEEDFDGLGPDEEDEDEDEEESAEAVLALSMGGGRMRSDELLQVLPLESANLARMVYLVIDRMSDLVTCPLQAFRDLGRVPMGEEPRQTLPVFDNHRVARRFSRRNQRVIKVPDGRLLMKTAPWLEAKGITRLLLDGQVYSLGGE